MSIRKWAYAPGELKKEGHTPRRSTVEGIRYQAFRHLSKKYMDENENKYNMVMNDGDAIYFAQLSEDKQSIKQVDAYVWNGCSYELLPQEIAIGLTAAYFEYLDKLGEAFEFIDDEE